MPLFTPVLDVPHRPFCGPTAIAALTGVPMSRIEKMLRRARGTHWYRDSLGRKMRVKGTYNTEVVRVLERLGCKVIPVKEPQPSLRRFVDDTQNVRSAYLVNVPRHYVVTHQGRVFDNGTIESGPTPIAEFRRATRRVQQAWEVRAPEKPMFTVADPINPPTRMPKPTRDIRLVRMEKVAAQIAKWEAKKHRAEAALKKLRPKLRRYERLLNTPAT